MSDPYIVYPTSAKELNEQVPEEVHYYFNEAQKCIGANANTAAVVMCRAALEAIAKSKLTGTPSKKPLAKMVAELKAQNTINNDLEEWFDGLRVLGNKGAHASGHKPTKRDAADAVDFVLALSDYIFTYKQKFDDFKKRQSGS